MICAVPLKNTKIKQKVDMTVEDFILIGLTVAGLFLSMWLFVLGYFNDKKKIILRGLVALSATCAAGYLFLSPLSDSGMILLSKVGMIASVAFCIIGVIGISQSRASGSKVKGFLWMIGIFISISFLVFVSNEIGETKNISEPQKETIEKENLSVSETTEKITNIYKSDGIQAAEKYCNELSKDKNIVYSIQKKNSGNIQLKVEYL